MFNTKPSDKTGPGKKSAKAEHSQPGTVKKHIRRWWQGYIFGLLSVITLVLGLWGFAWNSLALGKSLSFWDDLYRTLQLFVLQSGAVEHPVGWQLEIARVLAPILAFYAAIRTLSAIFYERFLYLKLQRLENHIIICGLGRIGLILAKRLRENGERVVVIEKDELNDGIPICKEAGITVLIGDATHPEMLKKAGANKARYLIAVSGSDDTNMGIAESALGVSKNRRTPLTCLTHIMDPHFSHMLSWRCWTGNRGAVENCHFEFFNILRNGARILLKKHPAFGDLQNRPVHILVVGEGRFTQNFLERLVREWYHKNLPTGGRLRISLFGKDAEMIKKELTLRYRQFKRAGDLTAYPIDVSSAEFTQGDFIYNLKDVSAIRKIYVCLENSSQSVETAIKLAQLRIQLLGGQQISIVVVADHKTELITGDDIAIFELLDETCDPNLLLNGDIKTIAQMLYEFLQAQPGGIPGILSGDAYLSAARSLVPSLGTIGCSIMPLVNWDAKFFKLTPQEIGLLAERVHNNWVEELNRRGWRQGPSYDEKGKTSPWLIPWENLSGGVQEFYRKLVCDLPRILDDVDFEIYRINYELLAQKLHEEYRRSDLIIGEVPPTQCRNYEWNRLGIPLQQWYREKANRLIKELWAICYAIAPVEKEEAKMAELKPGEIDALCEMENEDWDRLNDRERTAQRDAVKRLLRVLAELGFQVYFGYGEEMARALHKQWIEEKRQAGFTPETEPFMVAWHKLPEYKKESNRKAAEHFSVKLKVLALGTRKATTKSPKPYMILTKDELEKMAEMEHERWMDEQIDRGFTYAPGPKDIKRKTSPYLLPWGQLSEEVKDWDRSAVWKMVELVYRLGDEVYRVTEEAQAREKKFLEDLREEIAQQFHQQYLRECERLKNTPETNPFMVPWDKLPEEKKQSNRRAAEHIREKFETIGCGIKPWLGQKEKLENKLFEFTPEEVEIMAKMEHESWFEELVANGWKYAPGPKDPVKKTSPYLVDYEKLPEEIKETDRNLVRAIPRILSKLGLGIFSYPGGAWGKKGGKEMEGCRD